MDEQISKLLKELIPGLSIDRPILSARIKGNNLELFLYGGERLTLPIPEAESAEPIVGAKQASPKKKQQQPSVVEKRNKGKK